MAKERINPEQRSALVAVGDSLRGSPKSWEQIDPSSKALVKSLLRPVGGFSDDQREFIKNWWMEVDDAILEEINANLPPHTICEPRIDIDGKKFVSSDLFTDAEDEGRLKNVLPMIRKLQLSHKPAEHWPVQEEV
jgi:hypothetical protein